MVVSLRRSSFSRFHHSPLFLLSPSSFFISSRVPLYPLSLVCHFPTRPWFFIAFHVEKPISTISNNKLPFYDPPPTSCHHVMIPLSCYNYNSVLPFCPRPSDHIYVPDHDLVLC